MELPLPIWRRDARNAPWSRIGNYRSIKESNNEKTNMVPRRRENKMRDYLFDLIMTAFIIRSKYPHASLEGWAQWIGPAIIIFILVQIAIGMLGSFFEGPK
jgi:hypothetical protein